jgi:hypothetical protein
MKPTEDQATVLIEMLKWSRHKTKPFFILTGSAGTGKTFLLKEFMKDCEENVQLTSTTHKAVGVLQDMTGCDAKTIHSMLALTVVNRAGNTYLKQDTKRRSRTTQGVKIIVIDEASMITSELLKFIKDDARQNNRKYVFIGDRCQLPPIEDDLSLTEAFSVTDMKFNLNKIVRQAEGSPVITLATEIRKAIDTGTHQIFTTNYKNEVGEVKTLSDKDFYDKIFDTEFADAKNNDKILAWTNATVKAYNSMVCSSYGIEDEFVSGLDIMFNDSFFRGDQIIALNGEESVVETCVERVDKSGLPCWILTIRGFDEEFRVIPASHKDDYDIMWNGMITQAKANPKLWHKYYQKKEMYADIRPNFALTTHKSQGSTFDNVFIDLKDIMKCRDFKLKYRLYYTAVTRASKNVYIRN